jgi:hypothetical protein
MRWHGFNSEDHMSDLLSVNVNEHTEKKGKLTYLSWAWAWAEVLKLDPQATWTPDMYGPEGSRMPVCFLPGGSAMVSVTVTIKGHTKGCTLPVMDNVNKAIKNPDARQVSDSIMRCMTKAIAMHGLGLYIYAGEDLPMLEAAMTPEDEARAKRGAELDELALFMIDAHHNGKDMDAIRVWYDPATWDADNPTKSEEQKYVWGLLREESKLRSAIKANKPE